MVLFLLKNISVQFPSCGNCIQRLERNNFSFFIAFVICDVKKNTVELWRHQKIHPYHTWNEGNNNWLFGWLEWMNNDKCVITFATSLHVTCPHGKKKKKKNLQSQKHKEIQRKREDTAQQNEIQEFPGKIGRAGLSMRVSLSDLVNYWRILSNISSVRATLLRDYAKPLAAH